MIVDCHVNIWNDQDVNSSFGTQLGRVRPSGQVTQKADAVTVYREMGRVDRAIIFPVRYADSVGIESEDETCAAAVAKYPMKFVGFGYCDPRREDTIDRLIHAIEDLELKGIKFGPIYNRVSLCDKRLVPVYEYLIKHNLPLTLHMGVTFVHDCPIDLGRPIHVDNLAMKYPELKIIIAHMGHPWYEECIVTIRHARNVYSEISAIFYRPWQFYNVLICAEEYGVVDKIFWGTDFPFSRVEESISGIRNVNRIVDGSNLPRVSEETMDRILHANPFEFWWHGGLEI